MTHPAQPLHEGFFIGGPHATAIVHDLHHANRVIEALCACTGDDQEDYTVTDLSRPPVQSSGGDRTAGIAAYNGRLLDLDYGIQCLKQEGYGFTAAARVQRVRDWLAARQPETAAPNAADQGGHRAGAGEA